MKTNKSWRMDRFVSAGALAALAAVMVALPLTAAPLDGPPAVGPATATDPGQPALIGPRRAAHGASMADRDRNRIADDLEAHLAALPPMQFLNVIVTGNSHDALRRSQAAVSGITVVHEFSRISAYVARVTAVQARAIAGVSGIIRVEQDARMSATLETSKADFGVDGARAALSGATLSATGANVAVCVADTGADGAHEQFVHTLTGSRIAAFKDFIGDASGNIQTEPYDDVGHGSHVSNILAGDGEGPSTLATLYGGVAPDAVLFVAKVLDYTGSGPDSVVMQGVEWCADQIQAAKQAGTVLGGVVNLSLVSGNNSDGQDALSQLVNALAAQGIVVVAGAGNSGAVPGTIGSPAAATGAITVGAVAEWSGNPNDLWYSAGVYPAPFSSRGPTADGRIKPDIMGPGMSVVAAYIENFVTGPFPCWPPCYVAASGTSMAAPFVAGVAALMIEAGQGAHTVDELRETLYLTAADRFPGAGKDLETGFGLVDASAAVNAILQNENLAPVSFPPTMGGQATVPDNSEVILPITVVDTAKPLAITLTLDGRNGRQGWSPDLDAQVLDDAGNPLTLPGIPPEWGLVPTGSLSTCPAGDLCGTAGRQETLYVVPPLASNYQVRVYAFEGRPNRGAGGSFSFEVSNGTTTVGNPVNEPPGGLNADAGPSITVADEDGDGFATVALDGSNSTGPVVQYSWEVNGDATLVPDGMFSSLVLPAGEHAITLTVSDINGDTDSHTVNVTVGNSSGTGGGGNGGGRGGGKPKKNSKSASLN